MSQAEVVYMAGKGYEGKIPNTTTVHYIVSVLKLGNWFTHKYLDEETHTIIHGLTGTADGEGCYGYWRFDDASYLYAICGGQFVIQEDNEKPHIVE